MSKPKKRGPKSRGLSETVIYLRCPQAMRARLDKALARRKREGRTVGLATLVREFLANALDREERAR